MENNNNQGLPPNNNNMPQSTNSCHNNEGQGNYYNSHQGCYNNGQYENKTPYPAYTNAAPFVVDYAEKEKSFKTTIFKLAIFALIVVLNANFLYYIFYFPAVLIVQALGDNSNFEIRYFISWLVNDLASYLIPAVAAYLLFRKEIGEKIPYPRHPNVSPVLNSGLTFFAACFLGSLAGFFTNAVAAVLDSIFGTGEIPDAMEGSVPPQGEMGSFWILFLFVAVAAPIFEELIFRKLLLYPLRRHGDWFAVIITALLFGFYHGNFDQMPYAFVVGMLFALLAVNTNSVIPSMVLHVLNNTLVTLSQYLIKVTGKSEPALSVANSTSETLALSFWIGIPAVALMIAGKLFKTVNKSVFIPKYQAKLIFTTPAFYVFVVFMALMMV